MNVKLNSCMKSIICLILLSIVVLFSFSCVNHIKSSGVALPKDWPVPALTLPHGATLVHYANVPDLGWRLEFNSSESDIKVTDHIENCLRTLKYLKLQTSMTNLYFSPDGLIEIGLSYPREMNLKVADPTGGDFSIWLRIREQPSSMLSRAKPL